MKISKIAMNTFLSIIVLILLSTVTYAISIERVNKDKIWSIEFNSNIEFSKENLYENIKVTDIYDREIEIYIFRKKDDTISVVTEDYYTEGMVYILTVDKDLKATGGKPFLKEDKEIIFKVNGRQVLSTKEIAKKANAVVYLEGVSNEKDKGAVSGSGFIINSSGIIITNYHVVQNVDRIKAIFNDNKDYAVEKILYKDSQRDIAVLKLKDTKNLPVIKFGDSDEIDMGEKIVTISSPQGYLNSISEGIISGIRECQGRSSAADIQFTAAIDTGSSGGVVMNQYGEAVGIIYAYVKGNKNLNFSIPINEAKIILDELKIENN